MGAHTRGQAHNMDRSSAGRGFAQARLERNKQQRSGSSSEQVRSFWDLKYFYLENRKKS